MKYLGILAVLVSMLLLFGCTSQSSTAGPGTSGSEADNASNSATNKSNVTTTGTTTTYTTTGEQGNTTVTTNIGSSDFDWCVAGHYYNVSETEAAAAGTVTGDIKGYVTYKGGQYCQVDSTITTQGYTISYTYYVSPDKKDMWVVTNAGGQTQEIHIDTETGQMIPN